MDTIRKYLYWAMIGLLVYMPFHVLLSQWLSTFTGGLELWKIGKDIFTAALTIVCVTAVVIFKKYTRLYIWIIGLAAAYAALHLTLLIATNQPLDTGILATTYNVRLFCYVLIGYSIALIAPKQTSHKKLAKLLLIISTVVCLVGLVQWVLPKDIMTNFGYGLDRGARAAFFIDDKPDLPRVFSSLRDPNSLGAFLMLPMALLVYGLLKYWKTNRRTLTGGLLLFHGLVLFLTFSRSAWLGAVLSAGALFAVLRINKKFIKQWAPFALVGLVVLAGFVFVLRDQYVVQNVVFHSDENTRMTDSNNLHLQYIQKGIDGIIDQPLGHGPGTAGLVSIHQEKGGLLTENYFVQIGYEAGLLGLVILTSFMVLVVRNLWRNRKDPLTLALLASFVGLTFMNLLLHTWANEAVAASWFLSAGFVLTAKASKKPTTET